MQLLAPPMIDLLFRIRGPYWRRSLSSQPVSGIGGVPQALWPRSSQVLDHLALPLPRALLCRHLRAQVCGVHQVQPPRVWPNRPGGSKFGSGPTETVVVTVPASRRRVPQSLGSALCHHSGDVQTVLLSWIAVRLLGSDTVRAVPGVFGPEGLVLPLADTATRMGLSTLLVMIQWALSPCLHGAAAAAKCAGKGGTRAPATRTPTTMMLRSTSRWQMRPDEMLCACAIPSMGRPGPLLGPAARLAVAAMPEQSLVAGVMKRCLTGWQPLATVAVATMIVLVGVLLMLLLA
mmetsp:Transcript_35038/g.111292  ORF Transcript_35038/g.111292 Transcript_35038/m.111292 type:complete len:290 (-) Transcript_35038:800-1669(-)